MWDTRVHGMICGIRGYEDTGDMWDTSIHGVIHDPRIRGYLGYVGYEDTRIRGYRGYKDMWDRRI